MEEEVEPDPEIQCAIFNWLAYEMASKHNVGMYVEDDELKQFTKEVRRKRRSGELCLRCNEQPSKDYDPKQKSWLQDKGFCEPCLDTLQHAGEYCKKCKYAFETHYMHSEAMCKLCAEGCDEAPRLQA